MPTYKNVSSLQKTLDGKVVEPGAKVSSFVYYNENEVGLLKESDAPYFNPVILSEAVDRDKEIVVPEVDKNGTRLLKYSLHFYLEKGNIDIFYNSTENMPSLKLYEGCRWNNRYFERKIDRILVRGTGKFLLWVIIEKIF